MPFLSISVYNFRNLENKTIDLSAPEIFLVGQNGQGKTNFLKRYTLPLTEIHLEHETKRNSIKKIQMNTASEFFLKKVKIKVIAYHYFQKIKKKVSKRT